MGETEEASLIFENEDGVTVVDCSPTAWLMRGRISNIETTGRVVESKKSKFDFHRRLTSRLSSFGGYAHGTIYDP